MTKIFLVLLFSAAAFANVFGPDRRIPAPMDQVPYNMIGKLIVDGGDTTWNCTAALVAPDWVLTNLHCIAPAIGETKLSVFFMLGYSKGKYKAHARAVEFLAPFKLSKTGVAWDPRQDFAYVRLNAPVGKTTGWFKLAKSSLPYLGQPAILAGYSGDFAKGEVLSIDPACTLVEPNTIRAFPIGVLQLGILHSCHMTSGASGGPIFMMIDNEPTIIALNTGSYPGPRKTKKGSAATIKQKTFSNDYANTAVDASYFYPTLSKLKDN